MLARSLMLSLGTVAAFALAPIPKAQAWRNAERFGASVQQGGGGGKYFTLSRAEGYGCAVCHSQGEPVPVQVRNLPNTGFIPGQLYRITVDWPDDMPSVALNVEMTDYNGAPFGQLMAPDPLTLTTADLCRESETPSAGQTTPQDPSGRHVLLISECGQAQTSFDWIAPSTPAQGYFSASILFSNRNGKLSGDDVVDISETLAIQGVTTPTTNMYMSQCTALDTRGGVSLAHNTLWYAALLIWGVGTCYRLRRGRSARHSNARSQWDGAAARQEQFAREGTSVTSAEH